MKYEIMFIVRPTLGEDEVKKVVKEFSETLTSNGAKITDTKEMGQRELAYEINDFILYHFLVNGSQGQKLSYLIQNAFNITEKEAKNYVNNFNDRFFKSQYKRLTMPEGVKILEVSLSPRNEIKLNGDTYPPKKI